MSAPTLTELFNETMIGNRGYLEAGIGFEEITRGALLILLRDLNDEITVQDERWRAADSKLQQLRGAGIGQIEVPDVPVANFHDGPHRSLIEAAPERFPNVSVMAYQATPSGSQFADQVNSSDITLFVELMAVSGPVPEGLDVEHEEIVHRRISRMTAAASIVMQRDRTLLGSVHDMRTPPKGGIGLSSWLRKKEKGAGPRYLWHGSRLQYTVTRHHTTF